MGNTQTAPNLDLAAIAPQLAAAIGPHAAAMDQDPAVLRQGWDWLGQHQLLALKVPVALGGRGLSPTQFGQFQALVNRYSGALGFLQAQHQSAGAMLAQTTNEAVRQRYLPHLATGCIGVGISFAHLRRPTPTLTAEPVPGGYRLQGTAPWVTGWGYFQDFIVAAVLPEGAAVYGVVPFQTTRQADGGQLTCGAPMALAAVGATNTVAVEFADWLLTAEQVTDRRPLAGLAARDRRNVLQHSFHALGCARAGLDIVQRAAQHKDQAFLHHTWHQLTQELDTCEQQIVTADPDAFDRNVTLRSWAIELAGRCAQAAVIASSGAANSLTHPAQRVYREALLFSVSGQTLPVMEASLTRLTRAPAPLP